MRWFDIEDFDCPCCGQNQMDKDFLWKLDFARTLADVPFVVTSGFRCPKHNRSKKVGGSPTSSHLKGLAADIAVQSDYARFRIIWGLITAGFKRFGVGDGFIHIDADPDKNQERAFTYYKRK